MHRQMDLLANAVFNYHTLGIQKSKVCHIFAPFGGRGTLPLSFPLVHLLSHLFLVFTFPFLSLALPIFFFCPSLPFLPE